MNGHLSHRLKFLVQHPIIPVETFFGEAMLKKALLINPPDTDQLGFFNPPLGLLYIAGTLEKNGVEVSIVDGCIDGLDGVREAILSFRPDVTGISALTPGRHSALECARLSKELQPEHNK